MLMILFEQANICNQISNKPCCEKCFWHCWFFTSMLLEAKVYVL